MKLLDFIEKQLTWDVICRSLQLQHKLLPTVAKCPICKTSSLRVCLDSTRPVIRMSCSHCKRGGSPLWWFNHVWNSNITNTLNRLQDLQIKVPPQAYSSSFHLQWEKLTKKQSLGTDAWDKQIITSWNRLHGCRQFFPLYINRQTRGQTADRWVSKLNRLVGVMTVPELHRISRHPALQLSDTAPALTIPFYVNHRQVCGIYGIHSCKNNPTGRYYGFQGTDQQAGLAWLDTAIDCSPSQSVLVTHNPLLGLKIQLKFASIGHHGAPLVCALNDGSAITSPSVWTNLRDRDLVFWTEDLDATTIEHAVLTDGKIRCSRIAETLSAVAFHEPWVEMNPVARLTTVAKTAIKAVSAVENFLSRASDARIAQVARDLAGKPAVLDTLLTRMKNTYQNKLRCFLPGESSVKTFRVGSNREVVEVGNQWFLDSVNTRTLLSDFTVRLNRFIDSGDDLSLYEGEIHYKDQTIPFREKTSTIENQLVPFVKDQLIENGLGVTVTPASQSRKLYNIAMRFNTPELVKIPRHVGWHVDQQSLVFPLFRIDRGGVLDTQFRLVCGEDCPAVTFKPSSHCIPDSLIRMYLHGMSGSELDILNVIADYVLGATHSQSPKPTCLIYDQYGLVWDAMTGLGSLPQLNSPHQYPTIHKVGGFFEKFINRDSSSVLLGSPLASSLIAGIQGRCNVLNMLRNREEFQNVQLQVYRDTLVSFFQFVLRQSDIPYKTISDCFTSWVNVEMSVSYRPGFYHRESEEGRLQMVRLLIDQQTTKKAAIVAAKKVAESPQGRQSILLNDPANPDALLLNVSALLKNLHPDGAYQLHPDQIVRLIENSPIYHGRRSIGDMTYLTVDRTWPFEDNSLFADKPNLRIIG